MAVAPINFTAFLNIFTKRKGLFFLTAFAVMTLGTLYTYVVPKKYEASSTVFIEKNVINELVKGIVITPSVDDSVRVLTTALGSRTLILKAIGDVDLNRVPRSDAETESLVGEMQRNTEIKVADKDQFKVKFRHSNPKIARDYVNALIRRYIEAEVASKRTESYDATNFLTEQIATYEKKVVQTESEVNQFKSEKSAAVNLDPGSLYREINLAQQKLLELQLRRRQLEEEKRYVKNATDPERQKLRVLQKKLEELRVQYTDEFPEVESVKAQIETLQKEMIYQRPPGSPAADTPQDLWKIDAEVKALKEIETTIQNKMAQDRGLLGSIPSSKNALAKLEDVKSSQKNMHDLLAMRSNQAELSKQMGIQDKGISYKIIDPAVIPGSPVSPNCRKLLLTSIAAGFAAAAALLLLLDQLDSSVRLVDSLRAIDLPLLAVIPFIKNEAEIRSARRQEVRVYAGAALYFSLILSVLLLDLLGITWFAKAVSLAHLPQLFAGFFKG